MKKVVLEFLRRGSIACGLGPVVLAVLYLILQHQGGIQTLTVDQVCLGIFSMSALAFVAGGMNALYQIERLPLMAAISIHGSALYLSYLATYLVNGWLEWGTAPILVFTGVFVLGYLVIWAIIYSIIRKRTARLNEMLKHKQRDAETDGMADFF
ncbi:MAG: DUF3021 domain-containing protein [Ruminococcaceae bacterium]|nr:DUF3021 domain-containing protein [Oscillospiraceae bacterium]